MEVLKYTLIKSRPQYLHYCKTLKELLQIDQRTPHIQDEIELLALLVETWDNENVSEKTDPVKLLLSLMEYHKLRPKDLVKLLGISKGNVSDILNYKKGMSKEVIRKLSGRFKVSQESLNRPYKLHTG